MMNKLKIFFCVLVTFASALILSAFDSEEPKIYDLAGILTPEQEEVLQQEAVQYAREAELDFVIATTADKEGKTAQQYAEDFFDQKGFGYENPKGSGVILLIDMEGREAWIATSGIAIQYLDDQTIEAILDEVFEYLPNEDYYNASLAFLRSTSDYAGKYISDPANSDKIRHWKEEGYSDYSEYYSDHYEPGGKYYSKDNVFTYLKNPLVSIFIAVVAAAIFLLIQLRGAKTRMTVAGHNYMDKGKFYFNNKEDIYLGTTTVRRNIPKKSSGSGSGGGGSFHTGSGGRSFGGGGRKF